MDISPNPECVGWVPQTCQALFLTEVGDETAHFELIHWDAGKRLWDIPCPEGGEVLAIGLTQKHIIFSVAEAYPSGAMHNVNESILRSGNEWVRTFYAVDVQDGKLAARWQAQFPHTNFDEDRDHFLILGDKLFYVIPKPNGANSSGCWSASKIFSLESQDGCQNFQLLTVGLLDVALP
jgi:hypothetical protein